jgi:hypothetical protein
LWILDKRRNRRTFKKPRTSLGNSQYDCGII